MKKCYFLLTTALPVIIASGAYAKIKTEQNIKQLPAVVVVASKESLTASDTASAKQKISYIPGGANIVPATDFQNTRAATIKDMLDYTPGVFSQPRVGEESRLSIRGSGLSRTYHLRGVNLYQDGIPINLADGAADFQDIDPLAFEHVEVYKGANGLQFGSASLGGAINFVSPTGYNSDNFTARAETGSFGTARGQVTSGNIIGNLDYFTSFSEFHSDGYRDYDTNDSSKFYSNLGYRINSNIENRTYFTYVNANLQLPGNLTKTQLRQNPKQANNFYSSNRWERNFNEFRIANKTTWSYDNVTTNAGIYTNIKDLDHPIFEVIDQNTTDLGLFADTSFSGTIASLKNELLLGTNLSTGDTDSKRYVNVGGSAGALTVDGEEKAKTANFYLQDTLHATDKLALIAGSQFIYTERDYRDRFFSDGDQSGVREYYGTSPRISAIYDINKNLQLFTNLSAAYEPPTFNEVEQATAPGLADISAQKSVTFEVGTRGEWHKANWDLSIYRSWLRDELMMYNVSPGVDDVLNAGRTIHQGLELGFDMKLLKNIFGDRNDDSIIWRTAYTFSDFRFDGDIAYGNNDIPGAPEHYIRTEFRYDHPSGFYIAPNFELVPKGYAVDMANTLYTSGYGLIGFTAGYDIDKHTTIFFDARNIADKTYAATTDVITSPGAFNTAVFNPGDGAAIYTGLKYKW